jgi:Protein of unknown function (DUF3604)
MPALWNHRPPRRARRRAFFGGWEFTEEDARSRNPAFAGYTKGVPMGGDLRAAPDGKSPTFLVAALKDPLGGNLDRVQIVKGWVDAGGARQEKVYDVVWSDDRAPGADGKLRPVGNTVDVATASWTNTIGASELITAWTDTDFDPALRAVYYARVIEIPTPRLDRVRRLALRHRDACRRADVRAGARLQVADLVHAGRLLVGVMPCGKMLNGQTCSHSAHGGPGRLRLRLFSPRPWPLPPPPLAAMKTPTISLSAC